MTAYRTKRQQRASTTLVAEMMLAPMVAAMRMPQMMRESQGLSPVSGETMGAIAEKAEAMTEGVLAAQMSLFGAAMRFWPEVMSGKVPSMLSGAAAEHSVHAALKPAGRRVKANYRRLTRGG